MIEYADRNKLDGAKLSYKKAMIRAEIDKVDAMIKELKAKGNDQSKAARQPPAANRSRPQRKPGYVCSPGRPELKGFTARATLRS